MVSLHCGHQQGETLIPSFPLPTPSVQRGLADPGFSGGHNGASSAAERKPEGKGNLGRPFRGAATPHPWSSATPTRGGLDHRHKTEGF